MMQEFDNFKWEKISKEFHLDDAAITHLKEIGSQNVILSGFFEDLEQYLGLNSFSDLCSQFSELKSTLDFSKTELSKASQKIASLEASNIKLLYDKDDALHSLQLQSSELNYFREKSLATENELQNLKEKIFSLETSKFNRSRILAEVESDKKRLKIKKKLLKAENYALKKELRVTKDILASFRAQKESDFQLLHKNLRETVSEYQMAKSVSTEFQARNKELYFEIDKLQDKLSASEIKLNLELDYMRNELLIQTELAENYRQMFSDSIVVKESMKKEIASLNEVYEKLCKQTETFRKEAITKHSSLLVELDDFRLQRNQNSSNNIILDLSHSDQRVAMLDQAGQIDRQLDQLESDYHDISGELKR